MAPVSLLAVRVGQAQERGFLMEVDLIVESAGRVEEK